MPDLIVTNADVWAAATAVPPVVPALTEACAWPVPVLTASAFTRLMRACAGVVQDVETVRLKLCDAHCQKNDDGTAKKYPNGSYVILDQAAFDDEFRKLLEESVTLANCRAIKLSELGDKARPTATVLSALGPLIVDDLP